jgi:hypothetical protein
MSNFGNVNNLTLIRNTKKDVYENTNKKHCSKKKKSNKHHDDSVLHDSHDDKGQNCTNKTICDRLCLTPPKDACEKKCVTHQFEVSLGECKVTRDVNIIHKIKANLEHHITENVICKHEPCTKRTNEEVCRVDDGKCCDVKFPECDDEIKFIQDTDCNSKGSKNSKISKKSKSRDLDLSETDSGDTKSSHKKHKKCRTKCHRKHKRHHHD